MNRVTTAALIALAAAFPTSSWAMQPAACGASAAMRVSARRWPPPLDRQVTLRGDKVTLRDAMAQLAAAAHVKLSYVAELLPLDRVSCLSYQSVAAGDVLADLLRGTDVEPVVAGDDQVVLAPMRRSAAAAVGQDSAAPRASVLQRVVVTGSPVTAAERSSTTSMDVVSRETLARQSSDGSLAGMLEGAVPGVWVWQQSPTTFMARYGSIRGASSFGLSYPKIYIDGIEVANPLLVRQLDPATIERLEVVRGPQGGALYGADANSGVINIITRHDGAVADGRRLELRSTAGVSGSEFAGAGVLTQQHALAFRTGTTERSAGLGLSMSTLGAYVPGAFAQSFGANGDARVVGARTVFTGTARFFSERAGSPANPLLPGLAGWQANGAPEDEHGAGGYQAPRAQDSHSGPGSPRINPMPWPGALAPDTGAVQSMRQYTLGGTLAFAPNDRWTHTFVLGADGYRLANPATDNGPIPSATDSALAAARGGTDRITARVSSTARFGSADRAAASLTLTAEHVASRDESLIRSALVRETSFSSGEGSANSDGSTSVQTELGEARLVGWRGSSGLVAQTTASYANRFFLTAGMRLERDAALVGSTRTAALPMLGGAVVSDRGDLTVKLRATYGKAIRPVQGAIHELALGGRRAALVAYDLAPEQQAGIEVGGDLFVGRTFGVHVTRFDQRATGLIQSVAVTLPARSDSRGASSESGPSDSYVAYQLQNVGAIANRGWELQGTADLGRLSLATALSLVDSRVDRLAEGYTGDLRAGERMLDVPARTLSLTGSWAGAGWLGSLTVARAMDWVGYDRMAVARALTSGGLAATDLVGERLRSFWRAYDGATRLRASFTRDLFRGVSLVLTGDNLLGQQRGEPDNATVVPGRTVTAGFKAKF